MNWLFENANWVFSGIGVAIALAIVSGVKRLLRKRSDSPSIRPVSILERAEARQPMQAAHELAHHTGPVMRKEPAAAIDSNRRVQTRTQNVVIGLGDYVQIARYDNSQLKITLRAIGEREDGKPSARVHIKGESFHTTRHSREVGIDEFEMVEGNIGPLTGDCCIYHYRFSNRNFELIRISVEHINAVAKVVELQVVQVAEDTKLI